MFMGRDRNPAPVKKVELSEKNIVIRIIAVIVLLVIGALGITYGISQLTSKTSGWITVTADDATKGNCSDDFVFLYDMGEGNVAERRAIMKLYSEVTSDAYKYFSADEEFENINNVYMINANPNKELQIPGELYKAFELLEKNEAEYLYLGPIYNQLNSVFMSTTDEEAEVFDPYHNEEVLEFFQSQLLYINDRDAIRLELLSDNKVILHVSDEYLSYANTNGIDTFIDFFWMKNAFIIDMIADRLIDKGYTKGTLSSYDGFQRVLYDSKEVFATSMYDTSLEKAVIAASMRRAGMNNTVTFRNYVLSPSKDSAHYYVYADGATVNSYVDATDGMYKSALNTYIGYSKTLSCAQILLSMAPSYIAGEFDASVIHALKEDGINSVYTSGSIIYYNDSKLKLEEVYEGYTTSYIN